MQAKPYYRNKSSVCQVCHQSCPSDLDLMLHCRKTGHTSFFCKHFYCTGRFFSQFDLANHEQLPHSPSHHPVWDDSAITCAECNETFNNPSQLRKHAREKKHSPYACSCEVKFARNDVLGRHIASYLKENAKYPCTFCRRHRGKQAFRRRDHLVQHLRGYHKMEPEEIDDISPSLYRGKSQQTLTCPHANCEAYRGDAFKSLPTKEQLKQRPFQKQSDYNKHMRDVHKESTFPCRIAGCDRVGAKGYMREKDLMKHITDKHPEAPQYIPSKPILYPCPQCGDRLSSTQSLSDHEGSLRCQELQRRNLVVATASP
ncbi:hypothetical protein F5Y10DRAFT_244566 [Nemania abortiva]|nr:hypothetical protein F5Y10DRAFT_244566 [Nemania abortiva]